jgi:hypothetical protein
MWFLQMTEKEAAKKETAEKEEDDEKDDRSWPSGSSDDDGPFRFPRVMHWFKCSICLNHLYQHRNSLFFHIEYMMMNEFLMPDMDSIASLTC